MYWYDSLQTLLCLASPLFCEGRLVLGPVGDEGALQGGVHRVGNGHVHAAHEQVAGHLLLYYYYTITITITITTEYYYYTFTLLLLYYHY